MLIVILKPLSVKESWANSPLSSNIIHLLSFLDWFDTENSKYLGDNDDI